jgi:hypothetical protein
MTRPIVNNYNLETNELINREMNDIELEQYEANKAKEAVKVNAETNKAIEKAALLKKLGITAEEAKLLIE